MTTTTVAPEIRWAQRSSDTDEERNVILLTIIVPDLQPGYKLEVASQKLTFEGTTKLHSDKRYAFELELFSEVETEEGKRVQNTGKGIDLVLRKKVLQEEFWTRLTKDKKVNFVKTDFDRWVDQDEQEDNPTEPAGQMDDMGMGGMPPGMGGMSGMPPGMMGMGGGGAGGMDIEKLMAQMGQMKGGMPGMGGAGSAGLDDDDSDDEPIGDSGVDASSSKGKGKAVDEDTSDMPALE